MSCMGCQFCIQTFAWLSNEIIMKTKKNKHDEKKSIIFNVLVGDFNAHTHIGDNR